MVTNLGRPRLGARLHLGNGVTLPLSGVRLILGTATSWGVARPFPFPSPNSRSATYWDRRHLGPGVALKGPIGDKSGTKNVTNAPKTAFF